MFPGCPSPTSWAQAPAPEPAGSRFRPGHVQASGLCEQVAWELSTRQIAVHALVDALGLSCPLAGGRRQEGRVLHAAGRVVSRALSQP